MDKQEIRSILDKALEEKISSSDINLWPYVKTSLVGRNYHLQGGEIMDTAKPKHFSRYALAILMIIALMAIVLATPQGRSVAQTILNFFTETDSTSFPLSPSQIISSEPDPSEPTAMPPSPLMSVTEAEAQVGFDIAELPLIPEGTDYRGVRLYGNAVSVEYQAQGGGGSLVIQQSKQGYLQSEWDQVPADEITQVKIGGMNGEFVKGTFVVYAGESSATWNPDAPILRLRWVKDDVWFQMTKFGDVEAIEYLDQAGLIDLAESMVIDP